jgi:hypothetical protein
VWGAASGTVAVLAILPVPKWQVIPS